MACLMVILSGLAFLCLLDASSASHCDKSTAFPLSLLVRKLPDPLIVKKGKKFDVSVTLHVKRKLPTKFKVDLDLWKKVGFWMKIPCISDVGSCDYDIDCNKLNCTQLLDMCTKCRIAIDDVTITIPIDVDFPGFLVNGKYWIGYRLYDASTNDAIACGEQYINIQI